MNWLDFLNDEAHNVTHSLDVFSAWCFRPGLCKMARGGGTLCGLGRGGGGGQGPARVATAPPPPPPSVEQTSQGNGMIVDGTAPVRGHTLLLSQALASLPVIFLVVLWFLEYPYENKCMTSTSVNHVCFADECGIVAQISQPLANSDISAYYISTFSFDHVLVSPDSPFSSEWPEPVPAHEATDHLSRLPIR